MSLELAQQTNEFTEAQGTDTDWHMPLSHVYFPKQVYSLSDVCNSERVCFASREEDDADLIAKYIPNIKEHLNIRLLQMLLSSYEMSSYRYPLAEYTTAIFGISKASEQMLYSLINAGQFTRNETDVLGKR